MERTRTIQPTNGKAKPEKVQALLQQYSELVSRVNLATQLGVDTYGGDRDVYQALGYPTKIQWKDYWGRYQRHDIAKAIIDRPVKQSWKGEIEVIETIRREESPFEKAWTELYNRLKLKSIFIRADKLTGIGQFSVLFLGLNDTTNTEALKLPVNKSKKLELLYVKPLSQQLADIQAYEENPLSPRYGLPLLYNVTVNSGDKDRIIQVHYSRVVHLVEDLLQDEVYGTPRLQAVYNRLIDLEKLIGGDAEMFWRGARPGYTGEVQPDYQMTDAMFDELKAQIDEFENNLRRVLINEGVKYNALAQQIADPINHVDVQIQMISAVTGIPKRILTGSERGELSSAQDKLEWISYVTARREEQNEPMILRPFIDKCIEIGVLPTPATPYKIVWDKLFSLSDKEKVEIGRLRAEAIKSYGTSAVQDLFPLDLFAEYFLAFDKVQVEEIMDRRKNEFDEEEKIMPDEEDLLEPGVGKIIPTEPPPIPRSVEPDKRGG